MLPLSEEDSKTLAEILSDLAELAWDMPLGEPPAEVEAPAEAAEAPAGG